MSYNPEYYKKHREQLIAAAKTYYEANRERVRASREAYKAAHRDELRARSRARYRQHREEILEKQRIKRLDGSERAKEHGITPEVVDGLMQQQEGRCAICRELLTRAYIDHNHSSGAVRGLLCMNCNTALGHFRDDPVRLREAATYVEMRYAGYPFLEEEL